MAAHIFRRYIWLLEQVSMGDMTFKKISQAWEKSSLNDRRGEPLSLKTFHNHIAAIEEAFDIRIRCQRQGGYVYVIEQNIDANISRTQRSLLNHLLISNIHLEQKHSHYIIIPQITIHKYVTTIFEAISQHRKIKILWGWEDKVEEEVMEDRWVEIAPYYVKGFTSRYSDDDTTWFLYGLGNRGVIQVYKLSHIKDIELLDEKFEHPQTPFEQIAHQASHTPISQKDDDDGGVACVKMGSEKGEFRDFLSD